MNALDLPAHWLWLTVALLLAIAEMVVPGVYLIWIAGAALLTGLVALTLGIPLVAQLLLFAVATIAAVLAGRRYLAANPIRSADPFLNDRAARLIGGAATVTQPIRDGAGRVRIGDGEWSAEGLDAPLGARLRIVAVRGTVVQVEPIVAGDRPPQPD